MSSQDDPEDRIRDLERPLAAEARASEVGGPWAYGGPFPGPPPQRRSGNRVWWIVGTVVVVGAVALAAGIAAIASRQLAPVRSIIVSPPTAPYSSKPQARPAPSTSAVAPGSQLSVSGINENRTIACVGNIVSVSGVSNTVVITGHCASLTVSGVKNSITVDAVDAVEASGFDNKVVYHSGTPEISKSGGSNVVERG